MKYKIVVFYVLGFVGDNKNHETHYRIITWETERPWYIFETILYYHPRKRLSHRYILNLPGICYRYPEDRDILGELKLILETRPGIKEATKIIEYERTF